ncbi:MAG: helix-hairpin-helix domain-containing protein, partial [Prevotella sp.]|nr:helix-hairpin-helix domain-containing protein [Prevotella sp.]
MKFLRRFNSSDRDAAIVLALVIIVSIVLFPYLSEQNDGSLKNSRVQESLSGSSSKTVLSENFDNFHLSLFTFHLTNFDPNTASESQLLSLGLSRQQVRNILKYRSRGGRYRVKEDFARLYGLTLEKYRQLEPYITIKTEVMAADVIKSSRSSMSSRSSKSSKSSMAQGVQEVQGVQGVQGDNNSSLFTLHSS